MKQVAGIWLPAHEQHMAQLFEGTSHRVNGRATYQHDKLLRALAYVTQWRVAVDVGAHVGLWSMQLAARFETLHAFEPVAEHRKCWERNIAALELPPGRLLYPYALGEAYGRVSMAVEEGCSGNGAVVEGGGETEMRRLDEFDLPEVDFLKVDCIGYELAVLRGAEDTLKRCRPVVCVEQKPGYGPRFGFPETGAVDYLQSLGATLRQNMSGVYVLSW